MTLKEIVELPWTWQGPRAVTENGETHYELTIGELPDFFVAAETREAVLSEAYSALEAFIQSYLENGEIPPLPDMTNWRFVVTHRSKQMQGNNAATISIVSPMLAHARTGT